MLLKRDWISSLITEYKQLDRLIKMVKEPTPIKIFDILKCSILFLLLNILAIKNIYPLKLFKFLGQINEYYYLIVDTWTYLDNY